MSCNIFPPTAGTHDITTPMEITSQRTTDGLPYFPFSVWVCTHRIWKVQRVWHWLCAGQSHGTFPPRVAQPNACRAQHSGYLTCASRTGWLACAVGDVHSPLRRGSPVCCVMRKAWGPVCVSDPASCLWGDLPAHPKNNAWDRGQQLQSQDKNNQIQHCVSKTRSWFLNNCSFFWALNAF